MQLVKLQQPGLSRKQNGIFVYEQFVLMHVQAARVLGGGAQAGGIGAQTLALETEIRRSEFAFWMKKNLRR